MDESASSEPLDCSSSNLSLSPVGRPDADNNSMMVDSSSGSSEESVSPSPSSNSADRRPSISDKDDAYWERRKRNNDSAKKSREKRRMNDMAMEQRLLELSKENSRLKSALEAQYINKTVTHDSVIVPNPKIQNYTPSSIHPTPLYPIDMSAKLPPTLFPSPLLAGPQLLTAAPGHTVSPFMQMCQLHALQNSAYRSAAATTTQSASDILSSTSGRGAFQPFHPTAKVVNGSSSPDSSTTSHSSDLISQSLHLHDPLFDGKQYLRNRFLEHAEKRCVPESVHLAWENIYQPRPVEQPVPEAQPQPIPAQDNVSSSNERPQSLLGTLLSTTRRSPSVPQSRTEQQSGLSCETSSHEMSTIKSDSDSLGSPMSSQGSTIDSHQSSPGSSKSNNSALAQALSNRPDQERYMDRRRRNNEAAKRCRANRRAFEYRSKRAQQLETENGELRKEMLKLSHELEHLKTLMAAKNILVNPT
ncbi:hypothetical protein L596_000242 [Steinernema carpocapsae]|uniref:BZIP domain-containing protein n=1 Tax=Steinernema carpocapsae TaxID=34508 RepID=A0A4U8UJT3_STECR|nr:hypothetical protein L596_000242 [Steinernema carpocapsae]